MPNAQRYEKGTVQTVSYGSGFVTVQIPSGPLITAGWIGVPPAVGQTVWCIEVDQGAWLCLGEFGYLNEIANNVDTSETTTSVTFADLTTVGPVVSMVTGDAVRVTLTAQTSNSGANSNIMSVAVSGVSSIAASDTYSVADATTGAAVTRSGSFNLTGLTPGLNVFTMKYRVGAGTGTWLRRNLCVARQGQ